MTLLFLVGGISNALADIYKYVDKYGRVTLTDKPNNSKYKKLVKTWKGWEQAKSQIALKDFDKNQQRHSSTIDWVAKRYGLPPSLVHAVISAESAYDTNAISRAGAVGLMQLMPETAKRYGVVNRRNPVDNVDGGTRYLRDLLVMFDNNLQLALAAYNAGEGAVKQYDNKVPPYKETRNYVIKVIDFYKEYQEKEV
ncbi:MAG: lytic transglycosylase domain-containing protein [Gammaproteobacteria bacterium]|nr:lytic transglycosylase domain-containing protein [Gammaproteobacteria bacterium]